MPSLADMRTKAKEAGLMKLDKLIEKRQHIPTNDFPIPTKELCERFEKLYTGCVNDVMREFTLLDQNLPHEIMPLRDEMVLCGEAFTVNASPQTTISSRSGMISCGRFWSSSVNSRITSLTQPV